MTLSLTLACGARAAEPLHGAGATFPAPVYEAWAEAYEQASGMRVRYDPVGSGLGIEMATKGHVDFGATDAPLSADQLAAAGLRQFPVVVGAVVPVVNIAGIAPGRLVLDAFAISAIYRGEIVNWRDPAIAKLNPGLALPDARITVVHRADASGSTWLWTHWLSESDPFWQQQIGTGSTIAWPVGAEGLGNEGVASLVQRTRAAIGYVAYAYAREHHLSDVALPSHDGPVVRAGRGAFEAALAGAHWHSVEDLAGSLTNGPGAGSWPIVGASYVLVRSSGAAVERVDAFFDWALTSGSGVANDLGYVALPPDVVALVRRGMR
ncbi:phosphate ABC transporter substrate-binding protein PstS [Scleromatobacter humisilvae]|uniref:Phosphate-binding protein PstS n=1 Tax=Scleromatobacter humisilvae TaxID=2897159 RepID=A0A9X2C084_9BURK|nr:phosphate ABC transporter substrate-binding protein PstS [Scleromatobacter humisilvae]MCK9687468.1 phosphate ABC transporter substrate-binding protein PstS [Scleromatobacter humisilvae]